MKINYMDSSKIDKTVTEQGLGSPVPVGAGSGRTGSPRPSSLDCHAPTVDYQAGELVSDTGRRLGRAGENRNKTNLLMELRESCRRGSSSAPTSPNIGTLDLTWDETTGSSTKRKRVSEAQGKEQAQGDEDDKIAAAVRSLVTAVDKEVRYLGVVVQENANTKKEIKETSATLRSMMSRLMSTRMQDMLGTMGHKRQGAVTSGLSVEDQAIMAKPLVEDAECQTLGSLEGEDAKNDIIKALQKENAELKDQLRRIQGTKETVTEQLLQELPSFDKYERLAKMKWPNEIFKAAFLVKGSPLRGNKEEDLMVLEEEERWQRENQGHRKALYERFPELHDLEGRLAALTVRTGVLSRTEAGREWTRWIVRAEVGQGPEEWFSTLTEVRTMMVEGGRRKICIYPPGQDRSGLTTRKMAELLFRDSGIKCIIFIKEESTDGVGESPPNGDGGNFRADRRDKTDALIVSQAGETYVETLKRVKAIVKPGTSEANSIKTIRKSKDGKMVIVVDNSDPAAVEKLVGNLREAKGPNLDINMGKGRGMTTLMLKDIDCLVTKDEVGEALVSELGGKSEDYIVGELRPHFGGNQAVSIKVHQGKAATLVKNGTLRIGLSLCSVKERMEVPQCYRCFKYGHMRAQCTENDDFSGACRKCGEVGHLARECSKELYCLNCKRPGHGAGSGQCPEFRKALSRARARAKRRY